MYLVTMYKSKTNFSVGHGNQLIHCSVIKWEFFEQLHLQNLLKLRIWFEQELYIEQPYKFSWC